MNVLEKISEEIEEKIKVSDDCNENLAFIDGIRYGLIEAKKIICSHMDEVANMSGKRLIDEQPTVYADNNWIPVSERLPEEHDSIFAKLKGTDKWNKAMFEKTSDEVNVTIEYEDGIRKTTTSYTLDGVWKNEKERCVVKKKVIAWKPLLEPYKGE